MVGMWPIYEWDEWDVYPAYLSEIARVSSLTQWDADPFMLHRWNGHTFSKRAAQLWRRQSQNRVDEIQRPIIYHDFRNSVGSE